MGQATSVQASPVRPVVGEPTSAEPGTQARPLPPDSSSRNLWRRFSDRCSRPFRRGRYSDSYCRIGGRPHRFAPLQAEKEPPAAQQLPRPHNLVEETPANRNTGADSSFAPPAAAELPQQPATPSRSIPSHESIAPPPRHGLGFSNPLESNMAWTDIGDESGRTSPRTAGGNDGPAMLISQVLALAASITARQLFGYRPESRPDDQFSAFLDSLYNGFQSSEISSMLSSQQSENGQDSDDVNESADNNDEDEADAASEPESRRPPGYFRMFRFRETEAGMIPVIIVSMRPANPSLMDFVRESPSHDADEVPWDLGALSARHPPPAVFEDHFPPPSHAPPPPPQPPQPPLAVPIETESSERPEEEPLLSRRDRGTQASWIIYVWGGTYPPNHPVFMAPSLLTDDPTYEDLLYIQELMGQHKPPIASQSALDRLGGVFTVDSGSAALGDRCAVCLTDFAENDTCRKLTCSHTYHQFCIDKWLSESQNTCPLCREVGASEAEA